LGDLNLLIFIRTPSHPDRFYKQAVAAAEKLLAADPRSVDGLRLQGNLAMADRHPEAALVSYEKANQIKPFDPDVVLALCQALRQLNRAGDAEKLAQEFLARSKSFGPMYDFLYESYRTAKRWQEAQKVLEAKAESNPKDAGFQLQLAQYYGAMGKRAEMLGVVQRVLDNRKEFPDARMLVGDFYAHSGDLEEARKQYETGVSEAPGPKAAYQVRLAKVLLVQKKDVEALKLLSDVLKAQPDDMEALALRAATQIESKKAEQLPGAIADYKELVKRKPNDGPLQTLLGKAYLLSGDARSAEAELSAAVRKPNATPEAQYLLASAQLALGRGAEALRIADDLAPRVPADPSVKILRARALMMLGRTGDARSQLVQLKQQFSQSAEVDAQLGLVSIQEKKYGEAKAIFEKLRRPGAGETRASIGLASALAGQGDVEKALQVLAEEVKKPHGTELSTLYMLAAVQAKKYEAAIEEGRNSIAQNPQSRDLRLRLAEAYAAKGDRDKAIETYREARKVAPKDAEAGVALAEALHDAGKLQEAIAAYREVMAFAGENPIVLNNFAYLLVESNGDLEEAARLAQRAVDKDPKQPIFKDTLGWVYHRKGLQPQAVFVLSQVVRQDPQNATYRYHLGASLAATGDKAGAKKELEAALSANPAGAEAAAIRELLKKVS
jgi:tetratricopeptide (TPR) repeat protein